MRPAKPTTTAATPPEPTQVILFSAFNNGAPSPRLSVVAETTGTCSQPSSADAGRPSAYRCFNDDSTIADPCFTDDDGVAGFLLCFGVIADESTVKVTPRELRPQGLDPDAMTQATPWALDLTDGQRCDFVLGGTAANDAGRLNYVCQQGVVYGETDRSSDSWIVQFQATGTEALVPIAVAAAYY
jgi:hypothetical protein